MLALYQRDIQGGADGDGGGQMIDLALYEPSFRITSEMLHNYVVDGTARERIGNRNPTFAPPGTFETRDKRLVQIVVGGDNVFERLASAMNMPELTTDPRFRDSAARIQHAEKIEIVLQEWISQREFAEVESRMVSANVPFGGIFTVADIATDPYYEACENIAREELGEVVMPSVVPKLTATPGWIMHAGPSLGSHNVEIYGGLLGKSGDELSALIGDGVI